MANFIRELMIGLIKNPSGSPLDFSKLQIQPNICPEAVVPNLCLGYRKITCLPPGSNQSRHAVLELWMEYCGGEPSIQKCLPKKRQTPFFTLTRKDIFRYYREES